MLRRERVFERDIFRFGTGTVIVLNLERTLAGPKRYGAKYRLFLLIAKIGRFFEQGGEPRPTRIDYLVAMVIR